MKSHDGKLKILMAVAAAAVMFLQTLVAPSATGADKPTFFQYAINSKMIVGGVEANVVPLSKPYTIKYQIGNVSQSGPGKLILNMYSDGTVVWTQSLDVVADGTFYRAIAAPVFTKATSNFGPFYLCAYEQLASGAVEPRTPCSFWVFVPIEVPIALVSNGCGGMTGYKIVDTAETKLLDYWTFEGIKVIFKPACDVHDAGYKGVAIKEPFIDNILADNRLLNRKAVDTRFKGELLMLCAKYLAVPVIANKQLALKMAEKMAKALPECFAKANKYYLAVRIVGKFFYDADPTIPGDQLVYAGHLPDSGFPWGVKRDIS